MTETGMFQFDVHRRDRYEEKHSNVCGCKSLLKRRKQISRPNLDFDESEIISLKEFFSRVKLNSTPNKLKNFKTLFFRLKE